MEFRKFKMHVTCDSKFHTSFFSSLHPCLKCRAPTHISVPSYFWQQPLILKCSRNRTIQNAAMTETQCSPAAALEFHFLTTYFNTTFTSVSATAGKGENVTTWCLKGQDTERTKSKNGLSLRSSIHSSK